MDAQIAPFVRKAWELVASGTAIQNVLKTLNEEDGIRTPCHGRIGGGPLARKSLYNILNDPFYAGYVFDGERFCKGFHERVGIAGSSCQTA